MILELAKAEDRGFRLSVDQSTGNGVSLEWHWNNPATRGMITDKRWNYVVLQDRSGGPVEKRASFETHARLLAEEIRNTGAETILYMTWANKPRPETQAILADAYGKMARDLGAGLAPVGLAWERAYRLDPGFNLHHPDGRHANPAGSYLAACVFYAVFFDASPEGLPGTLFIRDKKRVDLDRDRALFLQKIAFETVDKRCFP